MSEIKVTTSDLFGYARRLSEIAGEVGNISSRNYQAIQKFNDSCSSFQSWSFINMENQVIEKFTDLIQTLNRGTHIAMNCAYAYEEANTELINSYSGWFGDVVNTANEPTVIHTESQNQSSNATDIVNSAKSECNNGGERYKHWFYENYGGLDPDSDFGWCDRFTSWLLAQMGYKMPAGGCPQQRDYFANRGGYHAVGDHYSPKDGDVVFFDWNNDGSIDHVGIVYIEDGVPYVLQGNIDDKVCYYKISDMENWNNGSVVGYGDPTCLEQYGG